MISRRAFVATIGAVCAASVASAASASKRIAFVGSGGNANARAFEDGLRSLGTIPTAASLDWHVFDAWHPETLGDIVRRIVGSGPDVILAANPLAIDGVLKATRTIAIVGIDIESDPVARGWAATLARPGGNFTGFFLDAPEISAKQLQFLKEIRPALTRVGVIGDERVNEPQLRAIAGAAAHFGTTLDVRSIDTVEAVESAIADMARQRVSAVVVLTSPLVFNNAPRICAALSQHRLLSICPFAPRFAEAGGLVAYGPDLPDLFKRSADYVDRILKGAKAGDLPIQRPEKFSLVVNLKTARVLSVSLPMALVQRTDRVIE